MSRYCRIAISIEEDTFHNQTHSATLTIHVSQRKDLMGRRSQIFGVTLNKSLKQKRLDEKHSIGSEWFDHQERIDTLQAAHKSHDALRLPSFQECCQQPHFCVLFHEHIGTSEIDSFMRIWKFPSWLKTSGILHRRSTLKFLMRNTSQFGILRDISSSQGMNSRPI